jgi:hypothetical protein
MDDDDLPYSRSSAASGCPDLRKAIPSMNRVIAAVVGTYDSPHGLWCQSIAW